MSQSSDEIREALLALRCQRGDEEAWSELVHLFTPRLMYYLGRFVSEYDEQKSLLQEVWLNALRSIRSLRDERKLSAWLFAIAHRVTMSHYRSEYAREEQRVSESVMADPPQQDVSLQQFENAELVHHALSQIGWIEREVLTLLFLEDFSVAEIAGVQGVPKGTVKSRLHRARAELRSAIKSQTQRGEGETP